MMVGGHVAGFVNLCVCGSTSPARVARVGGYLLTGSRHGGSILEWVDVGVVGET